jgi:competence protein ComEA
VNITLFLYKSLKSSEVIPHQVYKLNSAESFATKEVENTPDYSKPYSGIKKTNKTITYFTFDPNTATANQWDKLGLSPKQIQVILNYRSKGGKFYKKEDLRKIYSISEKDYNRLESYITISTADDKPKKSFETSAYEKREVKSIARPISINTADTSELKQLKGIGSVLAARIVKFRDALGGFHSVNQIQEVYGISEETFLNIKDKLIVSSAGISKLKVNDAQVDQLSKRPYISKKQGQAIINYRQQHGAYANFEALTQNKALDQEFLRKIEPYLEF